MRALLDRHPKLTALALGTLAATGFEPLTLWPVTLACLAGLILLVERAPDRRSAFLRGWLFGVGHFTLGLNWIAHAFTYQDAMPHWFGYAAVLLLSLYLAVYPGLAALGAWWLHGKLPLAVIPAKAGIHTRTLPSGTGSEMDFRLRGNDEYGAGSFILLFAVCWLGAEYLRSTAFTGFAWNPLGAILLPTGAAIGSTLVGTYGLGALVVLSAGGLLLALRRMILPTAAFLLPFACFSLWGLIDRAPATPPGAPRIRVVQPNIGQDEKYSVAQEFANFRKLATLSGTPRPAPRLVFWPEAAIPAYLDYEPEWRLRLARLLGPRDLLMTGGDKVYFKTVEKDGMLQNVLAGANNSLWVVNPRGGVAARYSKAHLVPYGEYLPMRPVLSAIGLSRLVPGDADFWPGPGPQSLTLPAALGRPEMKMGVQICYEIIFSGQVVDQANRPAFLFNPSNDAWFGSWGPVQHLAQARLRALEEGLPIIRSTPTGISAIVDARGQMVASIRPHKAGFLDSALPPPLPPTLFSRLGNWVPLGLAVLLFGLAIAMRRGWR